ncbi:MAG: hypothetical protein P8X68_00940 [Desulfobacterales bacterium]|jgi:hypothetical protein
MQPNVKKTLNFCTITVAKPGLMITPLCGKHKLLGFRGLEFKRVDFDIPATKFLPEGEKSIPLVIYDLDNRLKLGKNQKLVAWANI